MKGGYQIIDLMNHAFILTQPHKIPGVGEKVKNANGKPIMVVNAAVSGNVIPTQYVAFQRLNPSYQSALSSGGHSDAQMFYNITINSETDEVTITTVA